VSSPLDLTTLANVKAWLSITSTNSDAILGALITAASRAIYANLGRASLLPRAFVERYDGVTMPNRRLYLRNWPVLSIASLTNNGVTIPPAPAVVGSMPQSGYLLELWDGTPPGQPQPIDVYGSFQWGSYHFTRGRQNVGVTYTAGYAVQGEAWTVPGGSPYTVTPIAPYGPFASDQGVVYAATGVALTLVSGTPAKGQYAQASGVYTFAAADANAAILISYGFVPQDLAQVCMELIGERYSYRNRIGEITKSLGGQETMTYAQVSIPKALDMYLQPYRAVMIPGV
jgi:hypothetical protein